MPLRVVYLLRLAEYGRAGQPNLSFTGPQRPAGAQQPYRNNTMRRNIRFL